MSAASPMLRLDPRRLEQLKAIAAASGTSHAGVITQVIREKIAAGVIPASIPGVTISKTASGVAIELSAGHRKIYSVSAALRLAEAIRGVVEGSETPVVNLDAGFAVLKQGTGFKIVAPFPGPEVSFPADLVLDLADLIEEAAK
jgi:hypothetical protein